MHLTASYKINSCSNTLVDYCWCNKKLFTGLLNHFKDCKFNSIWAFMFYCHSLLSKYINYLLNSLQTTNTAQSFIFELMRYRKVTRIKCTLHKCETIQCQIRFITHLLRIYWGQFNCDIKIQRAFSPAWFELGKTVYSNSFSVVN